MISTAASTKHSTPTVPVEKNRIALFIICFISGAIGGTTSTLMSVYLPVVVNDLPEANNIIGFNNISAFINALFIFGWAIGGFSWGFISDRIGRKNSLLMAIACYGGFTIITGMMSVWMGIVLCRFLTGFGVGGVLVVSFTFISEVWPQKTRAVVTGILSIAFPVGIFSAGLINYFIEDWRTGFMIGIIPLLGALAGIYWIKESEQWKYLRVERKKLNSIPELFSSEYRKNLILGSVVFGTMLIGLWAVFSWLPTWVQSMITATDGQKERGISMMLLGVGGLSGGFLSGWIVNMAGFRRSMITCFSLCAILSLILFTTNDVFNGFVQLEITLLALTFGISQGILSAFIPQLFPTAIRATATGFCFNIGRMLTATAVLFIGILVSALGGYNNSLLVFSAVFIIGLFVMLFKSTKPDNIKYFSTP